MTNLSLENDSKTLLSFFKEEIALPLNADFYIGFSEEHDSRIANLIAPEIPQGELTPENHERAKKDLEKTIKFTRTRQWRAAEIPGTNGHSNARAMARIGGMIACGGEVVGIRILSQETVEKSMEPKAFEAVPEDAELAPIARAKAPEACVLYPIETAPAKEAFAR